jgi:hypothetical protein
MMTCRAKTVRPYFKVGYDTDLLEFVRFNGDVKYNAPTLGLNTAGKINVIITGRPLQLDSLTVLKPVLKAHMVSAISA